MTTTIGNSSPATKTDIKNLANEQITAQTGITVASQTDMSVTESRALVNEQEVALINAKINGGTPSATFNAVVPDNSLVAQIAQLTGVNYESWMITENDPVPPANNSGFTPGVLATEYTIQTEYEAPVDLRLHVWNGSAVVTIDTTQTDEFGNVVNYITVTPHWKKPPSIINNFLIIEGPDPTSEILLTFSAASSQLPLRYDLYLADGTLYRQNVNHGDVVSNVTPNILYNFYIYAVDTNGLNSSSNEWTIRLTSATTGTLSIVQQVYSTTEGSTVAIDVELTGNDGTPVSVDVNTKDGGAIAGVNYNASTTTLNFNSGDEIQQVVITTLVEGTTGSSSIKNAQVFIVPGSETGGVTIVGYPGNAILFDIVGTDVPEGNELLQYTDANGYHIIAGDSNGWSVNSAGNPSFGYIPWMDYTGDDRYGNQAVPGAAYSNVVRAGINGNLDAITNWINDNPKISFNVNFTQTGRHYIHLRGRNKNAWESHAFLSFNGQNNTVDVNQVVNQFPLINAVNSSQSRYTWTGDNKIRSFNVTAVGPATFEITQGNQWMLLDRWVIVKEDTVNGEYVPANENLAPIEEPPNTNDLGSGPLASQLSVGQVGPYPGNLAKPDVPPGAGASYDPITLTPDNNAINVGTNSTLTAEWPTNTINVNVSIIVRDSSGNKITGATS